MNKHTALHKLAKKRKGARWCGFKCIADYANGAFDCDHVSPYTKSADNVDADIFVMLQDWCSDDWLSKEKNRKHYDNLVRYGLCPSLPANMKLTSLLREVFSLELRDTYATNLVPFIKPGKMNANIDRRVMIDAAREFGLPQIKIVQPKLVICLGQ